MRTAPAICVDTPFAFLCDTDPAVRTGELLKLLEVLSWPLVPMRAEDEE